MLFVNNNFIITKNMKKLYVLLSLLILASCGKNELSNNTATPQKIVAQAIPQELQVDVASNTVWEVAEAIETEEAPVKKEERIIKQEPIVEAEDGNTAPPPQGARPPRGWKAKQPVPVAEYKGGEITETEKAEGKVVELSTKYISPKTEVIMNISYTLDENDAFSRIEVTSPNYTHMPKFNNGIQNVIGLTITEATGYNVAGSTLGSVAFSKVLKDL